MSDMTDVPANAPAEDTQDTPAGVEIVQGREFMKDAQGRLVPIESVRPEDILNDQTVRKIMAYATDLSDQIGRFRAKTFDDIHALQSLVAEKYDTKIGGQKGNISLVSYDGTLRVVVQKQDHMDFGPELQIAKQLVDECIAAWAHDARPEIRSLVEHAFQVDKEGQINRSALFSLRRLEIEDEGWRKAMNALADSMRTIGSSTYVRFYKRSSSNDRWEAVSINTYGSRK